ncbi:hypothetical protein PHLGIDRAFT_361616 [Phlebiopsis gigantea 11061_1 CR5-6]|uniref:Uncharacterized protein n=1 Tax=Phlebiopsis gigantea (strain 11061_1 CR5-6) TaxID=745531 RepID=A0A0C3SA31_PHLG1|nr:hypothetical protein PHLGIDRAFT_361616 [Phlebiopsis gigantea 11061_1 CR5-6]
MNPESKLTTLLTQGACVRGHSILLSRANCTALGASTHTSAIVTGSSGTVVVDLKHSGTESANGFRSEWHHFTASPMQNLAGFTVDNMSLSSQSSQDPPTASPYPYSPVKPRRPLSALCLTDTCDLQPLRVVVRLVVPRVCPTVSPSLLAASERWSLTYLRRQLKDIPSILSTPYITTHIARQHETNTTE